MKNTALSFSLFTAILLLLAGTALAEQWAGIAVLAVLGACVLAAQLLQKTWLYTLALAGYVAASAGGILMGFAPHLLAAGSAFALAAWEMNSQRSPVRPGPALPAQLACQERSTKLLILSVGPGLLAAEVLLFVQARVPFAAVLAGGLLAIFGLWMFFRSQKKI